MGGEEEMYHQEGGMEKKGGMKDEWVIMGGFDSSEGSVNSTASSSSSSSSSDMMEDATSSSTSSSSPTSGDEGPLFGLSELMAQLPIKRGLSKYYQGKSQTFASLESVKSLEDLAKRVRPKRRKMVGSSKSYGGKLDKHHVYSPEATISKKSSRVSFVTSKGEKGTTLYYFNSCGTCREEPLMSKEG